MLCICTFYCNSWGDNKRGQLGHSNFETCAFPKLVGNASKVRHVKMISCGSYHSACIADPGIIFTWGSWQCLGKEPDSHLLLGARKNSPRSYDLALVKQLDGCEPEVIAFFAKRRVQFIICGESHTTVKSYSDLYSWGDNSQGQLGSIICSPSFAS